MNRARLFSGRTRPSPRFAAGLFAPEPETPRERAYRELAELRTAWHRVHGEVLSSEQAAAKLAAIRGLGRTTPQLAEGR